MSLRDVLLDEVKDLYSAEKQLIKALPKMAKGADDEMLRSSFLEHMEQTKGHAQRLEQVFELLGEKAKAKHCKGMEGLIEEGQEALEEGEEPPAGDVMLIGAALRVEHYEKAAYTVCVNLAKTLGEDEAADLLEQTLEEESETAEKLMSRGLELMQQGASEGGEEEGMDEDEEEEEEEYAPAKKSASKKSSAKKSSSKKSSAKKSSKR